MTFGHVEGTYQGIDTVVILPVTAGQQILVQSTAETTGADNSNGMYCWFSGHLIFAQWIQMLITARTFEINFEHLNH